MDVSVLDALLGFALAYSATYVLYCWVHSDAPAKSPVPVPVHARANMTPDVPSRRNTSSPA
jgi:hypothetical protein